jgi:hypothetical protein
VFLESITLGRIDFCFLCHLAYTVNTVLKK